MVYDLRYLWSAHFVEGDKDGRIEETGKRQVMVKAPGRHQQQDELWQKGCQAEPLAPPAV